MADGAVETSSQRTAQNRSHPSPSSRRTFALIRRIDPSGISGVGRVGEGVVFSDGTAVLRWLGLHSATFVFECLDDVIRTHGDGGTTAVVFDEPFWTVSATRERKEVSP